MSEERYICVMNPQAPSGPPLHRKTISDGRVKEVFFDDLTGLEDSSAAETFKALTNGFEPLLLKKVLQVKDFEAGDLKGISAKEPTLNEMLLWFYSLEKDGAVLSKRLKNVFVSVTGEFMFFKSKKDAEDTAPRNGLMRAEPMTFVEFFLRSRVSLYLNSQNVAEEKASHSSFQERLVLEASQLRCRISQWKGAICINDNAAQIYKHLIDFLEHAEEKSTSYEQISPFMHPKEHLYLYGEPLEVQSSCSDTSYTAEIAESKSSEVQCKPTDSLKSSGIQKKFCLQPNFLSGVDPSHLTTTLLWFSLQGQISPLHYDLTETLLSQVSGSKHVLLFPPSMSRRLRPYPLNHPHDRQSQVKNVFNIHINYDITHESLELFSKSEADHFRGLQCTLNPGDALYIPCGWWHHIWSTPTIQTDFDIYSPSSPIVSLSQRWDPYKSAIRNITVDLRRMNMDLITSGEGEDVFDRILPLSELEYTMWIESGLPDFIIPVWRLRLAQSRLLSEKNNKARVT